MLTQAHSLDTVGVMGRSVEDLALLADALQAYDERDPASLLSSRPRLLATATEDWPLERFLIGDALTRHQTEDLALAKCFSCSHGLSQRMYIYAIYCILLSIGKCKFLVALPVHLPM